MHYSRAAECCILQLAKNPSATMSPKQKQNSKTGGEQSIAYVYKPEHDAMLAQVQLERVALIEVQLTGNNNLAYFRCKTSQI